MGGNPSKGWWRIYSTTLSRDDRLRMYKLNEDGTIDVYNKEKTNFLKKRIVEGIFGVLRNVERVKVMKGASEYGATYMADLLSFVMVLEIMYNESSYASKWWILKLSRLGTNV